MKSLKQTRIEKGISRRYIADSLGINLSNLSPLESGKQCPTLLTRKRLELLLGVKINWLDTPSLNFSPHYKTDWDAVEKRFRSIIRMIAGLQTDERREFITTAVKHLRKLQNTG